MKRYLYVIFLFLSLALAGQQSISPVAPAESGLVLQVEAYDASIHTQSGFWPVFTYVREADRGNPLIGLLENFHATDAHSKRSFISSYSISPAGNQILYVLGYYYVTARFHDEPDKWMDYSELYYFEDGMSKPKLVSQTGGFDKDIGSPFAPKYWLDKTRILLEANSVGTPNPLGIVIYDVINFKGDIIPINERYISTPVADETGDSLFYLVLTGNESINIETHVGDRLMYLYNLVTGVETQIFSTPDFVKQKEKSAAITRSVNGCLLPGSPTYYLPWMTNKAMCVERDGPQYCPGSECNMSGFDMNVEYSDCNLTPGSNYTGACNNCPMETCGHNRPAIDFGDGGLWFQTGTPVLASANGDAQQREQAVGAGKYVIIRSIKTGGGYVYSHYMHLSQVASNIPLGPNNWVPVQRGNQIGLEGKTGGPQFEHYHFELRDAINGSSFYPIFYEYGGCTPKTGRTYISRNVPTDGSMQNGFDCSNVPTISSCNTTLTGQTTVGAASRYSTYGNGYHDLDADGPEKVYKVTTTSAGIISVSLTNVSYSPTGSGYALKPMILKAGSCSSLDPIANCVGTTNGTTATYENAPIGTYFIVVEGFSPDNSGYSNNGASGTYTLNVSLPCYTNLTDNGSSKSSSGRNITITAKVKIIGNKNAGPFYTKFFLSYDTNLGNDYSLVNLNYPGLVAGYPSSYTFTWPVQNSIPAGTYYLLETIDYGGAVEETNENDNSFYFAGPIVLPPPAFNSNIEDRSVNIIGEHEITAIDGSGEIDIQSDDIALPNYLVESLTNDSGNIQLDCNISKNGYDITSSSVDPKSTYILVNALGMVICSGEASTGSIECSVTSPGLYFLSISDGKGNNCVQKIWVN